jgi:alkylation response protein AidB-like acyl-CoA dehydrogenase
MDTFVSENSALGGLGSLDHSPLRDVARECGAVLREYAAETEVLRHVHPACITRLESAGLFKLLQPQVYGGHQISVTQFLGVTAELAKACPSTAWATMIYNGLMWVASLFPEAAQREFHVDPAPIFAGQLGPAGQARQVEGGYRFDGTFHFASGYAHANWLLAGSPVLDDNGAFLDHRIAALPKSQALMLDDWQTTSMAGTGSNSFVLKDVFVPAHMTLSGPAAIQGNYPTHLGVHNLYRNAFIPNAAWFLVGPMLGMAEGALEVFCAYTRGKPIAYTAHADQANATITHLQAGEAAMKIEAARALAERSTRLIYDYAECHEKMPFELRARLRGAAGNAAKLCREAIDILQAAGGGSVIKKTNPIQRYARDIQGASNHALIASGTVYEMYGRVLFGLDPNTPMV